LLSFVADCLVVEVVAVIVSGESMSKLLRRSGNGEERELVRVLLVEVALVVESRLVDLGETVGVSFVKVASISGQIHSFIYLNDKRKEYRIGSKKILTTQ
jgi:hypothetical protein